MRTTVTIDDELLAQVKTVAARQHRTLGSVLEDALREMLARQGRAGARSAVELPVSGDPADRPLVDILDKDALATALGDEAP
jgi:hypothetical protein